MIKFIVQGTVSLLKQAERIHKLKAELPEKIGRVMTRFGIQVMRTSKKDYLSGPRPEKLGVDTGRLRSSIAMQVTKVGTRVDLKVGSNVQYARIHEEGGRTPAHVIEPKNGTVLAWNKGGKWVFAKRVNHPGSTIKKRPFLAPAFEAHRPEMKERLVALFQGIYE